MVEKIWDFIFCLSVAGFVVGLIGMASIETNAISQEIFVISTLSLIYLLIFTAFTMDESTDKKSKSKEEKKP